MKLNLLNKTTLIVLLSLFPLGIIAQDLENIGSKTVDKIKNSPLKINGGISANSIFYNSNGRSSREPFTYFLQGNLNISWLSAVSNYFSNYSLVWEVWMAFGRCPDGIAVKSIIVFLKLFLCTIGLFESLTGDNND